MRTEDLVSDLAARATAVRPLAPPGARSLAWIVAAALSVGAGVAILGVRPDLDALVVQSAFVWQGLLAIAAAFLAVRSALVLAVPGAEVSPVARFATVGVLTLWAATLVFWTAQAGGGFSTASHWWVCFVRVVGIAIVPAAALLLMLRRAMPLRQRWTAGLALMAAAAAGALAIQLICPLDAASHALLGHFGPVAAFGLVGGLFATTLLRRPDLP